MIQLPPMPPRIAALPRDERGYPVPWFVAWVDGKPEFRCADARKLQMAIRDKRCWVCGDLMPLNQHVFVVGPMCSINKITAEPPCHVECAEFSAMACPFLTKPKAVRREAGLPESREHAGVMIERNPGVCCLWACKGYVFNRSNLFELPNPAWVRWYCEGRRATRGEIIDAIETGLPLLMQLAQEDGAADELLQRVELAKKLIPAT